MDHSEAFSSSIDLKRVYVGFWWREDELCEETAGAEFSEARSGRKEAMAEF